MTRKVWHTMDQVRRAWESGELAPGRVPPTGVDRHNAVIHVDEDKSLVECSSCDPALGHFPAALKANIARHGRPLTCSSALLADHVAPFTAGAVRRLEAAGAGFSMITAMDEFGMGSSCEYAVTGPVSNPWDPTRTPGGSSGGSAAAVACGAAWYALGSDTGGSVRLPAAFCGLVGLKPTWGRVSRSGLVAFASSLDTIGVLARGVEDAALVLQTMAGPDPHDATTLAAPVPDLLHAARTRTAPRRLGVPREMLAGDLAPEVGRHFDRCLAELTALGARISEVSLPLVRHGVEIYQILAAAEASSNLARFDGGFYGRRRAAPSYQEGVVATRTAGFGPEVKRRLLWGAHVLAEGYRDELYLRARAMRRRLAEQFHQCLNTVDLLILPTAPESAFPLGQRRDDPAAMHASDVFTVPASLAGLPAVSLPMGRDEAGLPLGVQLVGPALGEELLIGCAAALEARLDFANQGWVPWQED